MTDLSYSVSDGVIKKLKDMGDGTYAEVVSLATTPEINIGDVGLLAGSEIVGKVGIDQTTGQNIVTDGGTAFTTVWGVSGVPVTTATTFSTTATTDAPTGGQKLCIDDLIVSSDAVTKITFAEETSGTVMFGPLYLAANSIVHIRLRGKKKLATVNKKLVATSVGSANVSVQVGYHSEA